MKTIEEILMGERKRELEKAISYDEELQRIIKDDRLITKDEFIESCDLDVMSDIQKQFLELICHTDTRYRISNKYPFGYWRVQGRLYIPTLIEKGWNMTIPIPEGDWVELNLIGECFEIKSWIIPCK